MAQFEMLYRLYLKLRYGVRAVSELPAANPPNRVLQSRAEWREAVYFGKRFYLPLHRVHAKNWDHMAAVHAIVSSTPKSALVLDAGAEIHSNVLPALFVCGYRHLYGMNRSFANRLRRGPIQYLPGDITRADFPDSTFNAITCMGLIEPGISLPAYFREMSRLLKPGGLLITSTHYYPRPIDTANESAHHCPIGIFSRPEVEAMLTQAKDFGFNSTGELNLDCARPPMRSEEHDLGYTSLLFTLRKA